MIFAVDSGLRVAPLAQSAHAEGAYKGRECQPHENSRGTDTALLDGRVGAHFPYFVAALAAFAAGTPGMPLAVGGSTGSGSDAVLSEMHLELAAAFDQW